MNIFLLFDVESTFYYYFILKIYRSSIFLYATLIYNTILNPNPQKFLRIRNPEQYSLLLQVHMNFSLLVQNTRK